MFKNFTWTLIVLRRREAQVQHTNSTESHLGCIEEWGFSLHKAFCLTLAALDLSYKHTSKIKSVLELAKESSLATNLWLWDLLKTSNSYTDFVQVAMFDSQNQSLWTKAGWCCVKPRSTCRKLDHLWTWWRDLEKCVVKESVSNLLQLNRLVSQGGKVVGSWISIPATRVRLPPGYLPQKKIHQSRPVCL